MTEPTRGTRMTVESYRLKLQTKHEGEMQDVTERIQALLENSKIRNGVAVLFVPGSTAAVTTIEYEPGLLHDFPAMLERIAMTLQVPDAHYHGPWTWKSLPHSFQCETSIE